jgi:hypothetical protein
MLFATAVNDVTSAHILTFALNNFPKDVSAFHSSLGYEITARLSRSLSQLYPSGGKPQGLDDRCQDTQMAPSILEDLSMLLQTSFFEEAESSNRKTTQKSKTSRRTAPTRVYTEINDRLFRALGPQVPKTRESAEEMMKSIVDNQKNSLRASTLSSDIGRRYSYFVQFFFTLLQHSEIATLVRNTYFRGNISQGVRMDAGTLPETGANHPSSSNGDPMRADLHFQSAAGYGQWRILCSRVFLSDMTRDNAQSNEVLGRLRYVLVIFQLEGYTEETHAFTASFH